MSNLPDKRLRRILKQCIYKMQQDIAAMKALIKEIKWSQSDEKL